MQRRILILTHDVVGDHMAGPAVRCWEFAKVLSREAAVTLATPFATSVSPQGFKVARYDAESLEALASDSDVILLSGYTLWRFPFLAASTVPLVVDIYDPFLLETLPLLSGLPAAERQQRHGDIVDALVDLFAWGDFFLCASERQRDYWLGWLSAVDRVNPLTYDDDPTLRRLVDVVAFGVPATPPKHTQRVLKGVRPGIAPTDHVVLWAGGIYNWFDPLTLIRAMARVSEQRSDVKLVFLGIRHPNPDVDQMDMAERAVALSKELDLHERSVFFQDWTPYEERASYLLEADAGISLHFAHLETHFSFRTRLLDHLWAALPTIVTRGDVLSRIVEENGLGWVVDYQDVEGVTQALLASAHQARDDLRPRFETVVPQFHWERVMAPLLAFCRAPRPAADRERTRSRAQSLPTLQLVSQLGALRRGLGALRRGLDARDDRLAVLDNVLREREATIGDLERKLLTTQVELESQSAELERLRRHIAEIRQGRVMRLLNGINNIFAGKGSS